MSSHRASSSRLAEHSQQSVGIGHDRVASLPIAPHRGTSPSTASHHPALAIITKYGLYRHLGMSCVRLLCPIKVILSMDIITNIPSWVHVAQVSRMSTKQSPRSLEASKSPPKTIIDCFIRGNIIEIYRATTRSAPHKR
jgi:hypothetical protein